MSIGLIELLCLVIVAVGSAWAIHRTGQRWLAVFPCVVLIAAAMSPADLLSTLMIAVPNALLCGVAVRLAQRTTRGKTPTLP